MKISKKEEAEALQVYMAFMECYLSGDVKKYPTFFDSDFRFVGTVTEEEFLTKTEAVTFYEATADQFAGKLELRNRNITSEQTGELILIGERCDGYFLAEGKWTFYSRFRMSTLLQKKQDQWKFIHQHISMPDLRADQGETIALDQIRTENLQLREAVKRRTLELEHKTRQLEIESSLERVRTIAMGMRKPDDMLDVCRMISEQLEILGVKEIRNVQTAIIDEGGNMTYMNYQYFTQYKQGTIELVDSAKHPAVKDLINQLQQSQDAFFTHSFEGVALAEWNQYRKDDHQFPDPTLNDVSAVHFYFYSIGQGGLGLSAYSTLTEDDINVFHRLRNIFALAYQRFRDIEHAEAQARESKIELALERVRARTMAMQHSGELQDTSLILFQQLKELGEPAEQCTIGIVKESEGVVEISATLHGNIMQQTFRHSINEPFVMSKIFRGWKDQQRTLIMQLNEEELQKYNQYRNELVGSETFPVKLLPGDRRIIHVAYFSKGMLALSTNEPRPAESLQLLERFAKVFEQSYTRFLDLQKAEAQTREAQIEAGLERVRSRTMAMHKSEELADAAQLLYHEFGNLGISSFSCGYMFVDEAKQTQTAWVVLPDGSLLPNFISFPLTGDQVLNNRYEDWKQKKPLHIFEIQGEANKEHHRFLSNYVPPFVVEDIFSKMPDRVIFNCANFSDGYLLILATEIFSPEDQQTIIRFAKVFEQTYTRFLDLQKAEAQAREAQIETALERVRSRSMGMQKSVELKEVIKIVYDQFVHLNINLDHAGFVVDYQPKADWHFWIADKQDIPSKITHPYFKSVWANQFNEAKENSAAFFVTNLNFEEKNKFYNELLSYVPGLPEASKDFYLSCPGLAASTVLSDNVALYIENFSGIPYTDEENNTLMRFGKVFQQTYTRFLDLEKAEAQVREAKIEASLERVRSRTMAMQKSEELPEAATLLFQQIQALGMPAWSAGYTLWDEDKKAITLWMSSEGVLQSPFKAPLTEDPSFIHLLESHLRGETLHVEEVGDEALVNHYQYMRTLPGVGEILEKIIEAGFPLPTFQIFHAAYFSQGFLLFITYEPVPDAHDIFKRFAKVFDQTYTRFLDLQKSESQTQKVKVEVALERVRARALAMQEPEELVEVAQVMRHEMGLLGIEELETSSIYIHDEGSDIADCWYAIKDIRVPEKKLVADHITMELHKTWVGREMLDFYNSTQQQTSIVMQGANRIEWIKYCSGISDVLEDFYGEVIPDRTYHLYKFSNGAIGAAAEGDISEESWELLRRATSVFSLAYSRFKDLTQARMDLQKLKTEKQRAEEALAHLKAAQTQLIQSEKMASLGELTAGIAHEIQNPLNFVNNFSDVNTELIEEMKEELLSGNTVEALAIAKDIADNEQKINHHGKRADAIVKGMLQHSRSSSGVKEPTDINALADEYLRLAYHGLRAKDKSFNATMKTDFDPAIGLVNIIPQDIGRVILNLITNAFYAVTEKAKMTSQTPYPLKGGVDFEPLVSVSTTLQVPLSGGRGSDGAVVTISVRDNGPGIPQHILDKIFQPFFTTKPTGQGTGLGLSLSYDIVKAHGGELIVETKEGEGTEFTIILPM